MLNYIGSKCPYCGVLFAGGDDVVVCPQCGTPHHRACYSEHGRCANEARHAEGFVWSPDPGAQHALAALSQRCPACGYENADGATECARCGRPLAGSAGLEVSEAGGSRSPSTTFVPSHAASSGDALEQALAPYAFEDVKPDDKIDGFTIREWATYVAHSVGYYIYCFKLQDDRNRKTAFTWSAMVFAPIYFLYRRVWWAAAAAWLANLTLGLPSFISQIASGGSVLGLSYAQWQSVEPITRTVLLAINIMWGVFAAWIYRKNAVRSMEKLRAANPDDEAFHAALSRSSGPSLIAAIAIPIVVAFAFTLLLLALGFTVPADATASLFGGVM